MLSTNQIMGFSPHCSGHVLRIFSFLRTLNKCWDDVCKSGFSFFCLAKKITRMNQGSIIQVVFFGVVPGWLVPSACTRGTAGGSLRSTCPGSKPRPSPVPRQRPWHPQPILFTMNWYPPFLVLFAEVGTGTGPSLHQQLG